MLTLMSYEQFAQKQADKLKRMRKFIGVSASEVEDTIFSAKSSVLRMENNQAPAAFRDSYLEYIYTAVMEGSEYFSKRGIDIFRELEFTN